MTYQTCTTASGSFVHITSDGKRTACGRDVDRVRPECARYWGSDGTRCSTHGGRFASGESNRCALAATPAPAAPLDRVLRKPDCRSCRVKYGTLRNAKR